jgi:hypothetical protein
LLFECSPETNGIESWHPSGSGTAAQVEKFRINVGIVVSPQHYIVDLRVNGTC